MSLTIKEKVGVVCAFIPLVSTVSGLIKAVVYYKKAKGLIADLEKAEKGAEKVNQVGMEHIKYVEIDNYNKLWKISIAEMIPLFNVIAAIYSAIIFAELSEIRELIKNPGSDQFKKKVFELHGFTLFTDSNKNEKMLKVLDLLDPAEKDLSNYCYGAISGKDSLSAEQLVTKAREDKAQLNNFMQPKANPTLLEKIKLDYRNSVATTEVD